MPLKLPKDVEARVLEWMKNGPECTVEELWKAEAKGDGFGTIFPFGPPTETGAAIWYSSSKWLERPAWREVDVAWLDRAAAAFREEDLSCCSEAAARASGALRLSDSLTAVKIMCGAEADDFEKVALSINPGAVIENVDGDDIVVMPTAEAHAAFVAWCTKHVTWD